jgi:hypothetical protein
MGEGKTKDLELDSKTVTDTSDRSLKHPGSISVEHKTETKHIAETS